MAPLLEHHAASGHHLQAYWLLPLLTDIPWFLTEGKPCCYIHHTFLLGFPTGRWKTINTVPHQALFWRHCQGGRRRLLQGEFSHAHPLLCLLFCLLYFCLHRFIKNPKKLESFIVAFIYLLISLVRMSNPEDEVRTFKQQGGEILKDAWYRISNSHHRCTKKHSTMILLRSILPFLKHAV
jgi:hypothetical protein